MKYLKTFENFTAENLVENQTTETEVTGITESEVAELITEGRSVSSIAKEIENVVQTMKSTVDKWKKESTGSAKDKLKEKLKELTDKKKDLSKELTTSVKELDKYATLQVEESAEYNNEIEISDNVNNTSLNENWIATISDMLNDGTIVSVAGEAISKGAMIKAMIGTFLGFGLIGVAPAIVTYIKTKNKDLGGLAKDIKTAKKGETII